MILKNKKLLVSVIILVSVLIFGVSAPVRAATLGSSKFFGGMVTFSMYCACSANFLVTIGGPVGGQFVFPLGSSQFPYYRLTSIGVWALGLYEAGGQCVAPFCSGHCCPFGAPIGTITPIVGTSL